jgi:hypothetical protein
LKQNNENLTKFLFHTDFAKNQCALSILNQWETNCVIIRGPIGEVLRGPNFIEFQNEVEEIKRVTVSFHPQVANRILFKFLAENGFEKKWETTTITTAQQRYGLYHCCQQLSFF